MKKSELLELIKKEVEKQVGSTVNIGEPKVLRVNGEDFLYMPDIPRIVFGHEGGTGFKPKEEEPKAPVVLCSMCKYHAEKLKDNIAMCFSCVGDGCSGFEPMEVEASKPENIILVDSDAVLHIPKDFDKLVLACRKDEYSGFEAKKAERETVAGKIDNSKEEEKKCDGCRKKLGKIRAGCAWCVRHPAIRDMFEAK